MAKRQENWFCLSSSSSGFWEMLTKIYPPDTLSIPLHGARFSSSLVVLCKKKKTKPKTQLIICFLFNFTANDDWKIKQLKRGNEKGMCVCSCSLVLFFLMWRVVSHIYVFKKNRQGKEIYPKMHSFLRYMALLYLIMRSAAPLEAKFLQLGQRLFFFLQEKKTPWWKSR